MIAPITASMLYNLVQCARERHAASTMPKL
jgi:hypothetical protein